MYKLVNRLSRQVGSAELAKNILVKRKDALPSGLLTVKGKAREKLGDAGRAIDRKAPGALHAGFQFDARANKAVRKKP